jgi:hypothetical protein
MIGSKMFKKNNNRDVKNLVEATIYGSSEEYPTSINQIQGIYFNEMNKVLIDDLWNGPEHGIDLGINYQCNSYGYRGPDPINENDVLTLGCSQTFGIGIKNSSYLWPELLSDSLGLSYTSLAKSGSSINSQVRRAFAYFKKFGHPKNIFAIFPDFQRMEFPPNSKRLVANKVDPIWHNGVLDIKHLRPANYVAKVSSLPHDARDIFTEEMCYFFSLQYIMMLEQYCNNAGINFVWGTWSEKDENLILKLKQINNSSYKNFIQLNNYQWTRNYETQQEEFYNKSHSNLHPNKSNCHEDYSNLEDFHIASDKVYDFYNAHSGIHRHLHWAETMSDYAIKNEWVK